MQSLSLSELKFFFNVQGLCLIAAMILLLFTEHPLMDKYTPILTGELPFVIISLVTATVLTQLFINLQSNRIALKAGIMAYGLLTGSLLIFFIAS